MTDMIGKIIRHKDHPWLVGRIKECITGQVHAKRQYENSGIENSVLLKKLQGLYGDTDYYVVDDGKNGFFLDVNSMIHYDVIEQMPLTWLDIGRDT